MEEAAEQVLEVASDPARLKSPLAILKAEEPAALAALLRVGASPQAHSSLARTLAGLREAAARGDTNATGCVATDVLLALADAIEVFQPACPGDVLRLETLAIRIRLDLARGQRPDAVSHAEQLAKAWSRLRPSLPDKAAKTGEAFSLKVDEVRRAIDDGHDDAAVASARKIGGLVEELEAVFPGC